MVNGRTEEQRAADDALDAALDLLARAYGWSGYRQSYVVAAHTMDLDADGTERLMLHIPAAQSWPTTFGLAEMARIRLRENWGD